MISDINHIKSKFLDSRYRKIFVFLYRGIVEFIWYLSRLVGHIPNHSVRLFLYKHLINIKIGSNSNIHMGARFYSPSGIEIGKNCVIGPVCFLDGRGKIFIGNNCVIAGGTWLLTAEHVVNSNTFDATSAPIRIEDYVWIGSRALILPGVTIGKGSVVAAGTVVTKNVEPYSIMGGVPAKKIGERIKDLTYEPSYRMFFG